MDELLVFGDGRQMGRLTQKQGRLAFTYSDDWRGSDGAYPLSTSMPLVSKDHGHRAVTAFLWGLLPDNEQVLQRWARTFQVSARNPFALLSHVGEDCAGAVQFVSEKRAPAFLKETGDNAVEWLSEKEIGRRLTMLKQDAGAGRSPRDTGQFSLAGAQPKTALYYDGKKWGIPHGRMPTTHILKPPTDEFDGFAENEHVCLQLAAALGLPAARSTVQAFDGATTIVVERYDRRRVTEIVTDRLKAAEALDKQAEAATAAGNSSLADRLRRQAASIREQGRSLAETSPGPVLRVHQEDFCQALSIPPVNKYQNQGGPGPTEMIAHLRTHAANPEDGARDVLRLVDAQIFNWLIGGTDAHGKNYSILIGASGRIRLAPLYDIASILAYAEHDPRKVNLAMKIGDEYRLSRITGSEWLKFAATNKLEQDLVLERIRSLGKALPDALSDTIKNMRSQKLDHRILKVLEKVLPARCLAVSQV
ncbi:type II toxin-antitoxin system HipA family toxin [Hyphomonas sp. NPDC076900]|uniref:type II toxin-antitoxin system HipA family toxin n=1 Tax=unclassified Hyphomonas TaxID=2630699 RepID=UPI003D00A005